MLDKIKIVEIKIDNKNIEASKADNAGVVGIDPQQTQDSFGNAIYESLSSVNSRPATKPTNVSVKVEVGDLDPKELKHRDRTFLRFVYIFSRDISIKDIEKNISGNRNFVQSYQTYAERYEQIDKTVETTLSIPSNTVDYILLYVYLNINFEHKTNSFLVDRKTILNRNIVTSPPIENSFILPESKPAPVFVSKEIGDIILTRDKYGNSIFSFDMNMESILKNNSQHSEILSKNQELLSDVAKRSRILSVTMKRYRVKPSVFESGKYTYFNNREITHDLVVQSGDNQNGILIENSYKIDKTASGKATFLVGKIKEMKSNVPVIRRITGTDIEASKLTYGLYCYKVEFVIKDATKQVLRGIKLKVDNINKFLSRIPKNPKPDTIKTIQGLIRRSIETLKYFNAPEELMSKILEAIHPGSLDPEKAAEAEEVLTMISSYISSFLNETNVFENANVATQTFKKNGVQPSELLIISRFWDKDVYNSEIPKELGMHIVDFPNQSNEPNGLNAIPLTEVVSAFNLDVLKHYNSLNGSVEIKTEGRTFNPGETIENSNYRHIAPKRIENYENTLNPKNQSVSKAFNKTKMLEMGMDAKNLKEDFKETLNSVGVTMQRAFDKDSEKNTEDYLTFDAPTIDTQRKTGLEEEVYDEDLQNLFADILEQSDFLNCSEVVSQNEIEKQELNQMPLQSKAKLIDDKENMKKGQFKTTQEEYFNRRLLFNVEFLNEGNEWKPLQDLKNEAANVVVCRARNYASRGGVDSNMSGRMSTFNDHFILELGK